jgi:hypothetical protein
VSAWVIGLTTEAEGFYQLFNKSMDVLERAGALAVPALRTALGSEDLQLRTRAAVVLGAIGPQVDLACPDLMKALSDEKWYIRWEAARALQRIAAQDDEALRASDKVLDEVDSVQDGRDGEDGYVNSGENHAEMWTDAKRRAERESCVWPYGWVDNPLYPLRRGAVTGRLSVEGCSPENVCVVLSNPHLERGWQQSIGPYVYRTYLDEDGRFEFRGVIPQEYIMTAFAEVCRRSLR